MVRDHTIFTNVYPMFETKLIRHPSFWTFTETHTLAGLKNYMDY